MMAYWACVRGGTIVCYKTEDGGEIMMIISCVADSVLCFLACTLLNRNEGFVFYPSFY